MATTQKKRTQARIVRVGHGSDQDFIFPRNPQEVTRSIAPHYADVPIALANNHAEDTGSYLIEWVGNRPEDITVKFTLHEAAEDKDVEADLKKLDDYLFKDSRTGEPSDLVFKMGERSDRCRMIRKNVKERMYTPDLKVQWAEVEITLRTLRPRSA